MKARASTCSGKDLRISQALCRGEQQSLVVPLLQSAAGCASLHAGKGQHAASPQQLCCSWLDGHQCRLLLQQASSMTCRGSAISMRIGDPHV